MINKLNILVHTSESHFQDAEITLYRDINSVYSV